MEDEDISANTNAEIGVTPQLNDEKKITTDILVPVV